MDLKYLNDTQVNAEIREIKAISKKIKKLKKTDTLYKFLLAKKEQRIDYIMTRCSDYCKPKTYDKLYSLRGK